MDVNWDSFVSLLHLLEVALFTGAQKVTYNLLLLTSLYRSCASKRQRDEWVAIL